MTENIQQPRKFDVFLGGQAPFLPGSVVLGGLEGIKRRLVNASITNRIELLSEVLKYGDEGLDLVIQAFKDSDRKIKQAAYNLLRHSKKPKARQAIHGWNPYQDFQLAHTWDTPYYLVSIACSMDGTILAYSEYC